MQGQRLIAASPLDADDAEGHATLAAMLDTPTATGKTPTSVAEHARTRMAPHFTMEIHLHLSASDAHGPWVGSFESLEPMFDERLRIADGRMWGLDRPGLSFSLSAQAQRRTRQTATFGMQP